MTLVRGRLPFLPVDEGHNDITGFVFATVGVLFSVLRAFVVIAVWDRFTNTEDKVADEAAMMVSAYRDTQVFPQPQRSSAQAAYRVYAHGIMEREWSTHGKLLAHSHPDLLNRMYGIYRSVEPDAASSPLEMDHAWDHLHELEMARHERHLSLEATLPPVFWVVLVMGALITMVFLFLFRFENRRVHAVLTALLAASMAASLFLIFALDRPFTGGVSVSKYPFEHALLQFDAIDMGPERAPTG
jgi:hypothetical protein